MTRIVVPRELLDRYDRPGPRYTSYPPIPVWDPAFGEAEYREALGRLAERPGDPVAVYVHLPFCVSRCFYCGCNATVTRWDHVQEAYLDRLERELDLVTVPLGRPRTVTQLHWGGGTPNFLNDAQIRRLVDLLEARFDLAAGAERSIECDPRVGTPSQIRLLRGLGFNRISFGVQDLDADVQAAIGRIQPEERVRELVTSARGEGFASINLDLVYGLPAQTAATFGRTIDAVIEMQPDRVACFSYAHVPWARPNQKRIDAARLPGRDEKFGLFELAVERFEAAGYRWIGLDHFARAGDELAHALEAGTLTRNFMGYTVQPAPHMLAFGTSGIGEVAGHYVQNDAKLGGWQRAVDAGALPIVRGLRLGEDDLRRRAAIVRLMCSLELPLAQVAALDAARDPVAEFRPLVDDGFVTLDGGTLRVTPLGRFFLRNLCMVLDAGTAPAEGTYSRTV